MWKADLTDDRLMKRWLCNRVNYLWTFYNAATWHQADKLCFILA